MGIDVACNFACSIAEDRNLKGKWEALTSFDKNKQIQTGGKVQGRASANLNSIMLKSMRPASTIAGEPKEQISKRNWTDPQKPARTVEERREGGMDGEKI